MQFQSQVNSADGLPGKLCTTCKTELTSFYVFKQKSKRTDTILRAMLPSKEATPEPDPEPEPAILTKVASEPERCTSPVEPPPTHPVSPESNIKLEREETAELIKILDEPTAETEDPNYVTEDEELVVECYEEQDDEDESETKDDEDDRESVNTVIDVQPESMTEYEIMEYEELRDDAGDSPSSDCDQLFVQSDDLEEYKSKMHTGFKCEVCSKTFIRKATYLRHEKLCAAKEVEETNDDEKESLSEEYQLDDEYDTNSISTEQRLSPTSEVINESQFPKTNRIKTRKRCIVDLSCPVCAEHFKTKSNYDQHMRNHTHMNIINNYMTFYPCHTCRKIFLQTTDLKSHMFDAHNMKSKRTHFNAANTFYNHTF